MYTHQMNEDMIQPNHDPAADDVEFVSIAFIAVDKYIRSQTQTIKQCTKIHSR